VKEIIDGFLKFQRSVFPNAPSFSDRWQTSKTHARFLYRVQIAAWCRSW
jgi:hypothetical protein